MPRILPILALAIPVLFVLGIYAPTHHFFTNQYDDAYIGYRYAINLAQGHGLVFNIGELTDAASSFLYMVVLAFCWLLGIHNLEFAGALIGLLSLGFISLFTYKLALHVSSDRKAAFIVAICCGLNGLMAGWTLSGMEVLPWAAIVLWAVYLMVTGASPILICVAIAVAAFTRFEGIFLALPYLLMKLPRPDLKKEIVPLAVVLIAFILFYIVKHAIYGVWISHAFEMKRLAVYYQPLPHELIRMWVLFVSVPAVLSLYALTQRKYFFVLAYITLSLASVYAGPRSDWSRYSVHLLPLLYAFSAPALARLKGLPHKPAMAALVFATLAMSGQALAGAQFGWRNMTALAEAQRCRKELGHYIEMTLPTGETVASSDLGAISYMAMSHPFVDLMALTSADVLAKYRAGQTMDGVLTDKHITYFADTYPANSTNRLDMLLQQFPNVKQKSGFTIDRPRAEFTCTEKGGLTFILAKIVPKPDGITQ